MSKPGLAALTLTRVLRPACSYRGSVYDVSSSFCDVKMSRSALGMITFIIRLISVRSGILKPSYMLFPPLILKRIGVSGVTYTSVAPLLIASVRIAQIGKPGGSARSSGTEYRSGLPSPRLVLMVRACDVSTLGVSAFSGFSWVRFALAAALIADSMISLSSSAVRVVPSFSLVAGCSLGVASAWAATSSLIRLSRLRVSATLLGRFVALRIWLSESPAVVVIASVFPLLVVWGLF